MAPHGRRGKEKRSSRRTTVLPLLGSNQDSSDPESDVLPVTPRGSNSFDPIDFRDRNRRIPGAHCPGQPLDLPVRVPTRRSLLACLAAALSAGCRAAVPGWGVTDAEGRRNADHLFAAFAYRFHDVERDAQFAVARPRMARYAFVPSRIFDDRAVWSVLAGDSVRVLHVAGAFGERGYRFTSRPSASSPDHLGDQRHLMQLRRTGSDRFEWITHVDHAVGPVRAAEVAAVFGALFTGFEGRAGPQLLAESRQAFARTGRHMGQMVRIDSLRTTALADGSTSLALHLAITPDTLRRRYPRFAAYLDKYIVPSVGRIQLLDRAGASYFDLTLRDARVVVRLRARQGDLVALAGPAPAARPDSLRIRLDFTARFMIFRVGYRALVGDFTIERGAHVAGWQFRFRQEPEWVFPLFTDHLLRGTLRRPFEGPGSELWLGVRDDAGAQALSVRHVRTAVEESAIMRWIGGLGATAFGDFAGASEVEENRFLAELFGSLRQDWTALAP